jgi:RNA polymerase subunit RPABC4/transcription elongation factor Spt4
MAVRRPTQDGGVIEYGLVREHLLAKVRAGVLRREDLCDAHPELLRAANNLGRPTKRRCPICEEQNLVEVTYIFGNKLPPGGTVPLTKKAQLALERRAEPVFCYSVDVCRSCKFHHLTRKWNAGGKQPPLSVSKDASR